MAVRVVVTGIDADGVSRIEHDDQTAAEVVLSNLGGTAMAYPWQVALPPNTVGDGHEPVDSVGSFLPPPGSLNFIQFVVPPCSPAERDEAQLQAALDEIAHKLPGLLPTVEPEQGAGHAPHPDDRPLHGHRRDHSVSRLADGSHTELAPGDCVVQRGTSHAWHNPTDDPCMLSGVMIALGRA